MKFYEAVNLADGIDRISKSTFVIPVKVGLIVAKNRKALADALVPFYEIKNQIVKDYAEPGKTEVEKEDPHYEEAQAKYNEALTQECEVNLAKIKASDIENLVLPFDAISVISNFIEE